MRRKHVVFIFLPVADLEVWIKGWSRTFLNKKVDERERERDGER